MQTADVMTPLDRLDNSEYSNYRRDDVNSGNHLDSPKPRQIEGVPVGDASDRDSTGTYGRLRNDGNPFRTRSQEPFEIEEIEDDRDKVIA